MASLLIDNLKTDISKHVGFRWWERMDSNHRSEDATDLQSAPIGHSGTLPYSINGAGGRIRTPDLLITNQQFASILIQNRNPCFCILSIFKVQLRSQTLQMIQNA